MIKKNTIPVSVIIPCYKSSKSIERAIVSILAQTKQPLEIIIVDDHSDDEDTYKVLDKLKKGNEKVEVILLDKNVGPGSARNVGWKKARGEFIAFLDSDDIWDPQKLELQYSFMVRNKDIAVTAHKSEIYKGKFTELRDNEFNFRTFNKFQFLSKNRLATRSVMLKADLPKKFLDYKRASEDFLLWTELFLSDVKIAKLDITLAYSFKNDFGDSGLTGNLSKMQAGELEVYNYLVEINLISKWESYFYKMISILKYLRRSLIVKKRRII